MKYFLTILLLAFPAMLRAYTLSGSVTEKVTGEPLPLATYHVFASTDTIHPIINEITDTEGRFATTLGNGDYRLTVEYAAKKTFSTPFSIADTDLALGTIALEELGEELQELTVVARKDLISSDGGTLTYDAERDPQSGTINILEMLRKVPMVTVDGEDNIKVKGNSNFKIYINGKPDPLLSGDPATILKSMPASSIKKIEVITDPGAKYDAEGTAGILNIVMDKKQSTEGYSVNARLGLSANGLNGSLYGRTKVGKVTASAQFWGFDGHLWRPNAYSNSERTDFENDREHYYRTNSTTKNNFDNLGGNINLSWEPDTLNLLTFSLSYYSGHSRSRNDQANSMSDIDNLPVWSYRRHFDMDNGWSGLTPSLSYQHTFPGNPLHTLTFTYQLNHNRSTYTALQESSDFFNVSTSDTPWMSTDNLWKSDDHTFQIDYSLPLFTSHSLDLGAKVLLRKPKGNTGYYAGESADTQETTSLSDITQTNDLYAAYASYNAKIGPFSSRVGIRYEHSRMGLRYHRQVNTDYPDFMTHLNDWVPNASVTFRINDASNLRAAYSMRIERPYLGQLNPAVNDLTYGDLSYGSPNLTTAHANNFELKYSNYGSKWSGEIAVSYSQTNDAVANISFMRDGIMHTTYENIGHRANTALNGYLSYQINDNMDANLSAGVTYTDDRADSGIVPLHVHGWNGYFNADYSYLTPIGLRVNVSGGYGTGGIYLQTRSSDWYYWDLSLSRSFLKDDALSVSLSLSDLLPARWKHTSTITTPTTVTHSHHNSRNWSVGLSVGFRFGSLRSDVKRTRASVDNNDAVTSGGSGGK